MNKFSMLAPKYDKKTTKKIIFIKYVQNVTICQLFTATQFNYI